MLNNAIETHAVETAEEMHLHAYNAAFYELGLRWHWDANTYRNLHCKGGETDRVRAYIETHQPHMLKAYDAEFLVNAIQEAKARCIDGLRQSGGNASSQVNWAAIQCGEVGV